MKKNTRNNFLNQKAEIYTNLFEDLIGVCVNPFLPYHEEKNVDGDKCSTKYESFTEMGYLITSYKNNTNKLKGFYNNMSVEYLDKDTTISYERLNSVFKKSNSIDTLLSLSIDMGDKPVYKSDSKVGSFIKTTTGRIDEEDSQFVHDYLESTLDTFINCLQENSEKICKFDKKENDVPYTEEEKEKLLDSVAKSLEDSKRSAIDSIGMKNKNVRSL